MKLKFLGVAILACLSMSAAMAQEDYDLPERIQSDANDVDVSNGLLHFTETDLSIGPQGAGGLSYGRIFSIDRWRASTLGTVEFESGAYHVGIGRTSHSFTLTGSLETGSFASNSGRPETLEYDSVNDKYVYTTADGAEYEFLESLSPLYGPSEAVLGK